MTNPHKKLSIIAVTWNSANDIPDFIASLASQTAQDFEFVVIDHASSDNSVTLLRQSLSWVHFPHSLILEKENRGFSKGYNRGIRETHSPWVLVSNVDMVYDPTLIERCLDVIQRHPHAGAIMPKLYRDDARTVLDSAGIAIRKSRQAVNRGEAENDHGQYPQEEQVFGASGALVLLNREVLEKVSLHHEYFDEDFFAYKEDVDLSWRLRRAGFEIWYDPSIVAVHRRGAKRAFPGTGAWSTVQNRSLKNPFARKLAFRNHYWMLLKNDTLRRLFRHAPWFLFYEIQKWGYAIIREPRTLVGVWEALKGSRQMWQKRQWLKKQCDVVEKNLDRWFE